MVSGGNGSNSAFQEVFEVRFCGSMQVRADRGTNAFIHFPKFYIPFVFNYDAFII